MNSIHADGGWALALTLTILFVALGFAAIRKRWPGSSRPVLATVDGVPAVEDKPKLAKEPAKQSHGHDGGRSLLSMSGVIVLWVVIIALAIYIIFHIPDIIDGAFRLAGVKVIKPQQSYVVPRTIVGPTEDPSRVQIESQSYTISLDDGTMPEWIRIPEGYAIVYRTEGLPKNETDIGRQCSSAIEEPPHDADGEAYWCKPESATGKWFRPYIYQHEAEALVFHYHFRHV